jgi:DNA mismatch repair protein MutL
LKLIKKSYIKEVKIYKRFNYLSNNRIKILPEIIANQIAAGEVVERPASVLKELVENSLDAKATQVVIYLRAGGKQQLVVQDDGSGMSHDDALLAIERHATSKISDTGDLSDIRTFGFRGEALPSIASVSRIIIDTKRREDSNGTRIVVSGGELKDYKDFGCPDGTRVEVRDLFFNTPARRKFMKSVNTEFSYIKDLLQVIVVAHPEVHFRAFHNEAAIFNYPAVQSLEERLLTLYNREFLTGLKSVHCTGDNLKLTGFLGIPTNTRSAKDLQYFYVNGRPVKNSMLAHAVYEGYQDTIAKGRHPIFLIFLELPYTEVDVNVHPSKIEVRFRQSIFVHDFVKNAIRESFLPSSKPGLAEPAKHPPEIDESTSLAPRQAPIEFPPNLSELPVIRTDTLQEKDSEMKTTDAGHVAELVEVAAEVPEKPSISVAAPDSGLVKKLSAAKLIGQLHLTYLLLEDENGLLIIDQHTAHERILYGKFLSALEKSDIKSQGLLFPHCIPATSGDISVLQKFHKVLAATGFELEEFGSDSIIVRAIPEHMEGRDPKDIVLDLLSELKTVGEPDSIGAIQREIARILACRSAVKAGDPLDRSEMEHLITSLCQETGHYTCPHGRPIVVRYSLDSIKKAFGR